MDEVAEKKGGFLGRIFGRKKEVETQSQASGETSKESGMLTQEEAAQRTQDNIARGGAKDFTSEIQGSPSTRGSSHQVAEPMGIKTPSGETLHQRQTQTAMKQSVEQGQEIREQEMGERIRQATTVPPRPETPGKKLDRMAEGQVREE
jgi:hypothetical protein